MSDQLMIGFPPGSRNRALLSKRRTGLSRCRFISLVICLLLIEIPYYCEIVTISILGFQKEAGATATELSLWDDGYPVSQNISFIHVVCGQNNGSPYKQQIQLHVYVLYSQIAKKHLQTRKNVSEFYVQNCTKTSHDLILKIYLPITSCIKFVTQV